MSAECLLIIAGVVLVFAILLVGEFLGGGLDLFTLGILPALSPRCCPLAGVYFWV
jgi:hypothetical protein